jgi:hypothetical protein
MITLPLETVLLCVSQRNVFVIFHLLKRFVRSFVCCLLIHRAWAWASRTSPHSTSSCVHLSPLPLKTQHTTLSIYFATSCNLELAQPPPFRWDGRNFRYVNNPTTSTQRHGGGSWKDANQLSLRQKKASPTDFLLVPLSRALLSLRELCGRKQLTFSRFVWPCDTETAASSLLHAYGFVSSFLLEVNLAGLLSLVCPLSHIIIFCHDVRCNSQLTKGWFVKTS